MGGCCTGVVVLHGGMVHRREWCTGGNGAQGGACSVSGTYAACHDGGETVMEVFQRQKQLCFLISWLHFDGISAGTLDRVEP